VQPVDNFWTMAQDPELLFADFQISRFELRRAGKRVSIQTKPLMVLNYLVRHYGRPVTKDELRAAVWEQVAVPDATIEKAVSRIRPAIDDDPDSPRFFKTIPGIGWVWLVEPSSNPQIADSDLTQAVAGGAALTRDDTEVRTTPANPTETETPLQDIGSGHLPITDGTAIPQMLPMDVGSSKIDRCKRLLAKAEHALRSREPSLARPVLFRALELARRADAAMLLSRARCDLGEYYLQVGDFAAAESTFEQVLRVARERRDNLGAAIYLNNVGVVLRRTGRCDKARARFEEALTLVRVVENAKLESLILLNLGRTYAHTSDEHRALELFEASRRLADAAGNDWVLRRALNEQGAVAERLGMLDRAIRAEAEALQVAIRAGGPREQQLAYHNIAVSLLNAGHYEAARASFFRAYTLAQDIGFVDAKVGTLIGLGRSHLRLSDCAGAVTIFGAALKLSETAMDDINVAEANANLASAWLALGSVGAAIECLENGLRYARTLGDSRLEGVTLCDIGVAFDLARQSGKSIPFFERALLIAERDGDTVEQAMYLRNLAYAYGDLGNRKAVDIAVSATVLAHSALPEKQAMRRTKSLARMLRRTGLHRQAIDHIPKLIRAQPTKVLGGLELLLAMSVE
jgi:tetratricopeptide (TPR) repeat protein/DNA-binding winged helix-turn-helix (wHTH) protein